MFHFHAAIREVQFKSRFITWAWLKSSVKYSMMHGSKYESMQNYSYLYRSLGLVERKLFDKFNLKYIPVKISSYGYTDQAPSLPISEDEKKVFKDINENAYLLDENDDQYDLTEVDERDLSESRQQPFVSEDPDDVDARIKMALEKLSSDEKRKVLDSVLNKKDDESEMSLHQSGFDDLKELIDDAADTICVENFESKLTLIRDRINEIEKSLGTFPYNVKTLRSTRKLCTRLVALSSELKSHEIVLVLQCLNKFGFDKEKNTAFVLQFLRFQMNTVKLKDIITLDYLLPLYKNSVAKNLPMAIYLHLERSINEEELEDVKFHHLLILLKICVRNRLVCTYKILEEIKKRGLIQSALFCLSFVWNASELPSQPYYKFMVPPEHEITAEMLTKECLAQMALHIEEFSPKYLCTTVHKMMRSFVAGHKFFYHEGLLAAMVKRALDEDWKTKRLIDLAVKAYFMHYVDDQLTTVLLTRLHKGERSDLFSILFSIIILMDKVPTEGFELLDSRMHIPTLSQLMKCAPGMMHFRIMRVIEFLGIGYINEKYFEAVLDETFLRKFISVAFRPVESARKVLLIDFMLRKDPSLSKFCLSESLRNDLVEIVQRRKQEKIRIGDSDRLDYVNNMINDPTQLVSQLNYKDLFFFEKLLVVDEEGYPVELLEQPQASDSDTLNYDDLNINPNHKRIAFLNIPYNKQFAPGRKSSLTFRVLARALELEGFQVIKCFEGQQCESDIEHELLCMGVKLSN